MDRDKNGEEEEDETWYYVPEEDTKEYEDELGDYKLEIYDREEE